MKTNIVTFFILLFSLTLSAQWEKVNDFNVGAAGKLVEHNNSIFLYGDDGPFYLYRSDDNGSSWIDLSSSAPSDNLMDIYSFDGKLFGLWIQSVFISSDNGESWESLSSSVVTGNGAITGFTHDGNVLYAYSNRKSVFKSTDSGQSWTEELVPISENAAIIDFAAIGNLQVAIFSNVGAYVSTDGGSTWVLNQPTTALAGVNAFNNELYGFSFGDGVYKYDSQSNSWSKKSLGLPSDGGFVIPKVMVNVGSTLFVSYLQLLGNSGVAISEDFGETWNVVVNEGIAVQNTNSSIAASATYLFEYYYGILDAASRGTYRTAVSVTSVEEGSDGLPIDYRLDQNYPNPFNPSTVIKFSIPYRGHVSLKIYDVLGNEIAQLVNEELIRGEYSAKFDTESSSEKLASGLYLYSLRFGDSQLLTKKMMILK